MQQMLDRQPGVDDTDLEIHSRNLLTQFSWSGIRLSRHKLDPGRGLTGTCGVANAGRLFAIMGPSQVGAGKTSLLDVLAQREAVKEGSLTINGLIVCNKDHRDYLRKHSGYSEQENALIGSLSAKETLEFACRLAPSPSYSDDDCRDFVTRLLKDLSLKGKLENKRIGTMLGGKARLSGGEQKRVDIATQLATRPNILLLDEPTSGLDSFAALNMVKCLRAIAQKQRMVVIFSIHQPSRALFEIFDDLLLLNGSGEQLFSGPISALEDVLQTLGIASTAINNPADSLLEHANRIDSRTIAVSRAPDTCRAIESIDLQPSDRKPRFTVFNALLHRALLKAFRDVTAYGLRAAMYLSLALMMGTVWLRLSPTDRNIQAFSNAIFFGGAFMSFMSVAYVPSFLEDRAVYVRERANGLYGPALFLFVNFLVGLPFLFGFSVGFSSLVYWLCNFRPSLEGYLTWVLWLFLDLVAAESLVVLVSSIIPVFVASLALTAFLNGLWMCTGGFLVPVGTLNPFWKYLFHYIDYQTYVFQGMMVNEFAERSYSCTRNTDIGCSCLYGAADGGSCSVDGQAILELYDIRDDRLALRIVALLSITLVMRLLAWLALRLSRRAFLR
ncbi:hypothetical protein Q7P37_007610 [Cladosporium fusiforme]